MAMKTKWIVPPTLMIQVGEEATAELGTCADSWNDSQLKELRARLPHEYHGVPTDWLSRTWRNLRKSGKYKMNVGGQKARSFTDIESNGSDEYNQWIQSEAFAIIAEQCKRNAEYRCQFCNSESRKGNPLHAHHRSYARMKAADEIKDLVALCRRCHFHYHDTLGDALPKDSELLF